MKTEKKFDRQMLINLLSDKARAQKYLDSVSLEGADLSCLNLTGYLFNRRCLKGANFTGSNLSFTVFSNADLSNANLYQAVLREAVLCSAKLCYAELINAKMPSIILNGADLRCAHFENADLYKAKMMDTFLVGAVFRGSNLTEAVLCGAVMYEDFAGLKTDFTGARMKRANLTDADMTDAIFEDTGLSEANLTNAILENADLTNANLKAAIMTGSCLINATMKNTNLSRAIGLPSPSDYMAEHFGKAEEGYIVYKSFDDYYDVPDYWEINEGSIITEAVNPNRTEPCGCGINVGTSNWVTKHSDGRIYKLLIRWEWLTDVVVPLNTDGKIRCGKAMILGVAN